MGVPPPEERLTRAARAVVDAWYEFDAAPDPLGDTIRGLEAALDSEHHGAKPDGFRPLLERVVSSPPRNAGGRAVKWRTGRKNPRTLYVQHGEEPSDLDPFIGSLDMPYARHAVEMMAERDELVTALARLRRALATGRDR